MLDRTSFFSRDEACKSPFGAVTPLTKVTFTLRPHIWEGFTACTLLTYGEFANSCLETDLPKVCNKLDRAVFSGTFTAPAQPELVWYTFRFRRQDGSYIYLGKNGFSSQRETQAWQLTVYDHSRGTPAWFGEGVTYQIFPDRFHRTGIPASRTPQFKAGKALKDAVAK